MSLHILHILHMLHMLHTGYGVFNVHGARAVCHVYLSHGQVLANGCHS